MPQNRAQEKAGEVQAYTVDPYVNKGLWQNSAYGTWTIQSGFHADAVNQYAEDSTRLWCQVEGTVSDTENGSIRDICGGRTAPYRHIELRPMLRRRHTDNSMRCFSESGQVQQQDDRRRWPL
jgi:hypothetical protein